MFCVLADMTVHSGVSFGYIENKNKLKKKIASQIPTKKMATQREDLKTVKMGHKRIHQIPNSGPRVPFDPWTKLCIGTIVPTQPTIHNSYRTDMLQTKTKYQK